MKKILLCLLSLIIAFNAMSCSKQKEQIIEDDSNDLLIEETFDFVVDKNPFGDFKILTLSDPQMLLTWWEDRANYPEGRMTIQTIDTLVAETDPDLILITGDFTADGYPSVFYDLGMYFDSFNIPWATVFGNHDHSYEIFPDMSMSLEDMKTTFSTAFENCLFKAGDPEMGCGNFTIGIREGERFVEAIFMMDSHTTEMYTDENGNQFSAEASINPAQQKWYREKVENMKILGCFESIIVTHQPLIGHNLAMRDAIEDLDGYLSLLTPTSTQNGVGWKDEYKDTSFGIFNIGCAADTYGHIHPDDGMHALIKELNHTKNAICGHCHENNTNILYDGVRYTHGLKTGGCAVSYWNYDFNQNGGTVIEIGSGGVVDLYHKYVPYPSYFHRHQCHSQTSAPFGKKQ